MGQISVAFPVYFLTLNNSLFKQYCLTMVYSQIYNYDFYFYNIKFWVGNYDLIKANFTCFPYPIKEPYSP